jgi:hypothetical protein
MASAVTFTDHALLSSALDRTSFALAYIGQKKPRRSGVFWQALIGGPCNAILPSQLFS